MREEFALSVVLQAANNYGKRLVTTVRKILHLDIARAQAELPVSRSAENAAHASGGLFLSGAGLITAVGSRTK